MNFPTPDELDEQGASDSDVQEFLDHILRDGRRLYAYTGAVYRIILDVDKSIHPPLFRRACLELSKLGWTLTQESSYQGTYLDLRRTK